MPINYYEKLLKAGLEHDENGIETWGINLLAVVSDNPFQKGTEAYNFFWDAQYYYRKWIKKGIDSRSSRVMMIQALSKLAVLNAPNPYVQVKSNEIQSPIDVEIEASPVEENEKTTKVIKVDPPSHVLGVVPEKKRRKRVWNKE